jgi:hypothetical protein
MRQSRPGIVNLVSISIQVFPLPAGGCLHRQAAGSWRRLLSEPLHSTLPAPLRPSTYARRTPSRQRAAGLLVRRRRLLVDCRVACMVVRGWSTAPADATQKQTCFTSQLLLRPLRPCIHQHPLDVCSRCQVGTNTNTNTLRHRRAGPQRWGGGLERRAAHSLREYPAIFIRGPFPTWKGPTYSLYVGGRAPFKQQAFGIRAPGHCGSDDSLNTTSVLHCTLMGPLAILPRI